MAEPISVDLLFRMIAHWLSTKPNTYYGSPYGNPLDDMLQKPLNSPIADAFMAKMRADIPAIAALPAGTVNMYATSEGVDVKNIYIEIAGLSMSLSDLLEVSRGNY